MLFRSADSSTTRPIGCYVWGVSEADALAVTPETARAAVIRIDVAVAADGDRAIAAPADCAILADATGAVDAANAAVSTCAGNAQDRAEHAGNSVRRDGRDGEAATGRVKIVLRVFMSEFLSSKVKRCAASRRDATVTSWFLESEIRAEGFQIVLPANAADQCSSRGAKTNTPSICRYRRRLWPGFARPYGPQKAELRGRFWQDRRRRNRFETDEIDWKHLHRFVMRTRELNAQRAPGSDLVKCGQSWMMSRQG